MSLPWRRGICGNYARVVVTERVCKRLKRRKGGAVGPAKSVTGKDGLRRCQHAAVTLTDDKHVSEGLNRLSRSREWMRSVQSSFVPPG
jgi:hypothetical protein